LKWFTGSWTEAKQQGWAKSTRSKTLRCADCRDKLILTNVDDEQVEAMLAKLRSGVRT
jgi:hypothetical protein